MSNNEDAEDTSGGRRSLVGRLWSKLSQGRRSADSSSNDFETSSFNRSASPVEHDPIDDTLLEAVVANSLTAEANTPNGPAESKILQSLRTRISQVSQQGLSTARGAMVAALLTAIRAISAERDRARFVDWLSEAGETLASPMDVRSKTATLYKSLNAGAAAAIAFSTMNTAIRNYQSASVPLSLKIAVPATLISAAMLGAKGAGVVALGHAVGLPVVALVFLGTAGIASVIEACVRDPVLLDPLGRLVAMFASYDMTRRAKKELLEALRADAMLPKAATIDPASAQLRSDLMALDPIAFERHVMSLFERWKYPTGVTPASNDFGVDGYLFHPDGLIVVQCKRYSLDNPVGRPAVQQLKGVVEEQGAFRGYLVTTGRFTAEAAESAEKSSRIVLVDGDLLVRWHNDPAVLTV